MRFKTDRCFAARNRSPLRGSEQTGHRYAVQKRDASTRLETGRRYTASPVRDDLFVHKQADNILLSSGGAACNFIANRKDIPDYIQFHIVPAA